MVHVTVTAATLARAIWCPPSLSTQEIIIVPPSTRDFDYSPQHDNRLDTNKHRQQNGPKNFRTARLLGLYWTAGSRLFWENP